MIAKEVKLIEYSRRVDFFNSITHAAGALGIKRPALHVVFHSFVLFGSFIHFFVIYHFVF